LENICFLPKSYQGINIENTTKNELLKTLQSIKTYNILLKTYTIIILKNQASRNISIDKNFNRYDNCSCCNTFGLSKLMNEIWMFRIYRAKFTLKNSVFLLFNNISLSWTLPFEKYCFQKVEIFCRNGLNTPVRYLSFWQNKKDLYFLLFGSDADLACE